MTLETRSAQSDVPPQSEATVAGFLLRRFGFWLAGFFSGASSTHRLDPGALSSGCVFLLPGIEGTGYELRSTIAGLRDAGTDGGIEVILWGTRPLGSIRNLVDLSSNRDEADAIAERIVEQRRAHPDARLTVIGYSGGAGVALLAVEALPPGVQVDRVILVSGAVAPSYDLSRAMGRCCDGIVNLFSRRDWLILGVGTSLLGTIDRAFTPAAGKVGFRNSDGALRNEPGLKQIAWCDAWIPLGHYGGHLGCYTRSWAREILAPQVTAASVAHAIEHR